MGDKDKFSIFNFQFSIFLKKVEEGFRRLVYYFRIWFFMSRNSFLMVLNQKSVLLIFLAGKVLRFLFFVSFLYFLVTGAENLAGYNSTQAIFFFLTFMIIDTTAQFFFREVYKFRNYVISGDFDLILVKPTSALFRVLMGGADVIDLVTLPPIYLATAYVGSLLAPSVGQVLIYILLILTGMVITTAFHIIVISFGIITLEVDHTIMIYRDISAMGRMPTDIYKEPLKGLLTYFIPVAIMMSLPAKAFMGVATKASIFTAFVVSIVFIFISYRFWNFALKKYTSASS